MTENLFEEDTEQELAKINEAVGVDKLPEVPSIPEAAVLNYQSNEEQEPKFVNPTGSIPLQEDTLYDLTEDKLYEDSIVLQELNKKEYYEKSQDYYKKLAQADLYYYVYPEEATDKDNVTEGTASSDDLESDYTNAAKEGAKHSWYNYTHSSEMMQGLTNNTYETLLSNEVDAYDLYMPELYKPKGINNNTESAVYTISRALTDAAIQIGTTLEYGAAGGAVGGVTGALAGGFSTVGVGTGVGAGVGAGIGAGIGSKVGTVMGMTATNAGYYNEIFQDNYYRFLEEGYSTTEAAKRASKMALTETAIESASDFVIAGLGKLNRVIRKIPGVKDKTHIFLKSLFDKKLITFVDGKLNFTDEAAEAMGKFSKDLIRESLVAESKKSVVKKILTNPILKTSAIEGSEELLQQIIEVEGHSIDTLGKASLENAGEIGRAGVLGYVSGGLIGSLGHGTIKLVEKATGATTYSKTEADVNNQILEGTTSFVKTLKPEPLSQVAGETVEGKGEVTENGDTVISDDQSSTDQQQEQQEQEQVEQVEQVEQQEQQEQSQPQLQKGKGKRKGTTDAQNKKKTKIRSEINKKNNLGNTPAENAIEGSVSDGGLAGGDSKSEDVRDGLAKEDKLPSTPTTIQNKAITLQQQLEKELGNSKKEQKEYYKVKQQEQNQGQSSRLTAPRKRKSDKQHTVSNEEINDSKLTKKSVNGFDMWYSLRRLMNKTTLNFSRWGKELEDSFNIILQPDLSDKRKRLVPVSKGVVGFVKPSLDNAIRATKSTAYRTIMHEYTHHLVFQAGAFKLKDASKQKLLEPIKESIEEEYKNLKKEKQTNLNVNAYEDESQLLEEMFVEIVSANAVGSYKIKNKVLEEIALDGFKQLGVEEEFKLMKTIFDDINELRKTQKGRIRILESTMHAAYLLSVNKYNTNDLLSEKELTRIDRIKNWFSKPNREKALTWLMQAFINETYAIEKEANKIDQGNILVNANHYLMSTNKMYTAFIAKNGGYIYKGMFRVYNNETQGIKNLTKIKYETEQLGEGYVEKLKSFLLAMQTIGESLGNQFKADNLTKMANDLGYSNFIDCFIDDKILTGELKNKFYQNKKVSEADIKRIKNIAKDTGRKMQHAELSESNKKINQVAVFSRLDISVSDKEMAERLTKMNEYMHEQAELLFETQKNNERNLYSNKFEALKDQFLLDKQGEIDTGVTLEDAIIYYDGLLKDPKFNEIQSLANDVRNIFKGLERMMYEASNTTRVRMNAAQASTGAFYIPLLRLQENNNPNLADIPNTLLTRTGSDKPVLDLFSNIEHSVATITRSIARTQAIDQILSLKDNPNFVDHIREVPSTSMEVRTHVSDIASQRIKQLRKLAKEYSNQGKLDEYTFIQNHIEKLNKLIDNISEGHFPEGWDDVVLFIDVPPTGSNIIISYDENGGLHYYQIDKLIRDFLYNQRKNIFSDVESNNLQGIIQVGNVVNSILRASYTAFRLSFQTGNLSRDSADVEFKMGTHLVNQTTKTERFYRNLLGFSFYYTKTLMYDIPRLVIKLASAQNREYYRNILESIGDFRQTRYSDEEFSTQYLNYKVNKKGKVVRGGRFGMLRALAQILGDTDVLPRLVAVEKVAKQYNVRLDAINASVYDYITLNLSKGTLSKYITNDLILKVFGKEKAQIWENLKEDEYVPFVPDQFEIEELEKNLNTSNIELDLNSIPTDIMIQLEDVFAKASIDFSKGTRLTRTLGFGFLFANARVQGDVQHYGTFKKDHAGALGAVAHIGILAMTAVLLGIDDDDVDEEERLKGIHLQFGDGKHRIKIPLTTAMALFYNVFRGFAKGLQEFNLDYLATDSFTDFYNTLYSHVTGPVQNLTGVPGIIANTISFIRTDHALNWGDTEKYHQFSTYFKQKVGNNTYLLAKKSDTAASFVISRWLVDMGISKFSTHETNRLIDGIFGNSIQQLESLIGLNLVIGNYDVKIKWKPQDMLVKYLSTVAKPFTTEPAFFHKDVKDLEETISKARSKYEYLTNQVGYKLRGGDKTLLRYDELPKDKYTKEELNDIKDAYDRWQLSDYMYGNLDTINTILRSIDVETKEGLEARNHMLLLRNRLVKAYMKDLKDLDPNNTASMELWEQLQDSVYTYTKEMEQQQEEENVPNKVSWLEKVMDFTASSAYAEELPDSKNKEEDKDNNTGVYIKDFNGFNSNVNNEIQRLRKEKRTKYVTKDNTKWLEDDLQKDAEENVTSMFKRQIHNLNNTYKIFEGGNIKQQRGLVDYPSEFKQYLKQKFSNDEKSEHKNLLSMTRDDMKHLVANYYLEEKNPFGRIYKRESNNIFNDKSGNGIGMYHFATDVFIDALKQNLPQEVSEKIFNSYKINDLTKDDRKDIQDKITKYMLTTKRNTEKFIQASNKALLDQTINKNSTLKEQYDALTDREKLMFISCINNKGNSNNTIKTYMNKLQALKERGISQKDIIEQFYKYHIKSKSNASNVEESFKAEMEWLLNHPNFKLNKENNL